MDSNQIRLNSGGTRLLVCAVIFACAFSSINAHGDTPSIIGVWKQAKLIHTDGDTTRVFENPQPGLFIAIENFYSTTFVYGNESRPSEPAGVDREDLTHDQLKSMSVPFISNAGTYRIEDNQFVFDPVVALNQNFQESGSHKNEFELSIDGNTLEFIGRNESGDVVWHHTWARLE